MNLASTFQRLGVGLESIPVPAEIVEPTVTVDQPFAVEDSIVELNEMSRVADTIETDMNQVHTAEDRLETIATTLEAFNDGRGLTRSDFSVVMAAVESATIGLGLKTTVPAVENFAGASARQVALNVATEAVGDKLKALADWGKQMFTAFVEWLKKFVAGLFDAVNKLEARATAVKEKADGTEGRQSGSFPLPANHAANLSIKQSYVRDLVRASAGLVAIASDEARKLAPAQLDAAKELADLLADGALEGKLVGSFEGVIELYKRLPGVDWTEADGKFTSGELIGGYGYTLSAGEKQLNFGRIYDVIEDEVEVPSLKPSQVVTLCDNILDLCKVLKDAKEKLDANAKAAEDFRSEVSAIQGENEHMTTLVRQAMSAQTKMLRGTLKAFTGYAVSVSNSMLVVANKSLAAVEQTDTKALPA